MQEEQGDLVCGEVWNVECADVRELQECEHRPPTEAVDARTSAARAVEGDQGL